MYRNVMLIIVVRFSRSHTQPSGVSNKVVYIFINKCCYYLLYRLYNAWILETLVIYIYIYIYVCVCVCVCARARVSLSLSNSPSLCVSNVCRFSHIHPSSYLFTYLPTYFVSFIFICQFVYLSIPAVIDTSSPLSFTDFVALLTSIFFIRPSFFYKWQKHYNQSIVNRFFVASISPFYPTKQPANRNTVSPSNLFTFRSWMLLRNLLLLLHYVTRLCHVIVCSGKLKEKI